MIADPFQDAPPTLDDIDNGRTSNSEGKNSAGQQGLTVPMGWKPTVAEPVPVVRCTGTIRNGDRQGERCTKWSVRGATVCIKHGAQLPNVKEHAAAIVEAARMRLIGLTDEAIDAIEDIISSPTTQAQVRLKAATEILDRAGIKGAPDLTVTVEHTVSAADTIAEKLKGIAARIAKPEDDELIDEGEKIVDADEPTV